MTKANSGRKVVAVMEDLMFMVRIQEAAKRAGFETVVVKTREAAVAKLAEDPLLFIVDLNFASARPLELISELKASASAPVIAFVPHVQTDLRAAAEAGGCDKVFARSAFAQNLPQILEDFVVTRSPR